MREEQAVVTLLVVLPPSCLASWPPPIFPPILYLTIAFQDRWRAMIKLASERVIIIFLSPILRFKFMFSPVYSSPISFSPCLV